MHLTRTQYFLWVEKTRELASDVDSATIFRIAMRGWIALFPPAPTKNSSERLLDIPLKPFAFTHIIFLSCLYCNKFIKFARKMIKLRAR